MEIFHIHSYSDSGKIFSAPSQLLLRGRVRNATLISRGCGFPLHQLDIFSPPGESKRRVPNKTGLLRAGCPEAGNSEGARKSSPEHHLVRGDLPNDSEPANPRPRPPRRANRTRYGRTDTTDIETATRERSVAAFLAPSAPVSLTARRSSPGERGLEGKSKMVDNQEGATNVAKSPKERKKGEPDSPPSTSPSPQPQPLAREIRRS